MVFSRFRVSEEIADCFGVVIIRIDDVEVFDEGCWKVSFEDWTPDVA